jgi:ribonuclease HI
MDVQHADLWRRVDRALEIHCVQACLISSRLVSGGKSSDLTHNNRNSDHNMSQPPSRAVARNRGAWEGTNAWDRIDRPHSEYPSRPRSASADQDGLRRWLLGDVAKQASQPAKPRFDSKDLF